MTHPQPRTEPRFLTPEDFPASTLTVPGMRTMIAADSPRYGVIHLNVPYARKSGRTLHLQVLMPPRPADAPDTDTYPTILYIQGSAFHEQMLGMEMANLAAFARRGYVIAVVEYRPSEVAPFPAQAVDAKTAVRWLREHAAEFHVDPERIAVWGDSSGGHTTLMTYATAADPDYTDEPLPVDQDGRPLPDGGLGVRAFVDYYGPTHIGRMNEYPSIQDHRAPESPEGCLIGGLDVAEHPELVAPTVIMNHVPPAGEQALPPLLVVHGDKDRLVHFSQSIWLVEDLQAKGQDVTFIRLAGADHGGAPFWQEDVLDVVDGFLTEHLA